MREEYPAPSALGEYEDDARFGARLAALAEYRALCERRWRKAEEPGDRKRLRAVVATLERTGGVPAVWHDAR